MPARAQSFLRLLAPLAFFLLATSNTHAQHQLTRQVYDTKTDTWVQVTCLFGKLPPHGYIPVRVEINNGTETDRNLTLEFTSKDSSSFGTETGSRTNSTFQASCAAGQHETYDFIVPVTSVFQTSGYGSGSELVMKLSCTGYPTVNASMTTATSESWPAVIASNAIYVPNASALSSQVNSGSASSRADIEFAGSFDPKAMPTDWRAYMGQDIIMLTSTDWKKLAPGARTAILDWNRLGSRLLIYTSAASDSFASLQISSDSPSDTGAKIVRRSMGTASLLPLPSSGRLDAAETHQMLSGGVLGNGSKPAPLLPGHSSYGNATTYHSILHDFSTKWPLLDILGKKHFNTVFFILILLAFGILIGPVNLFVFAKAGKRHKLFITTPVISLAASILLVVVIVFQDGFGGRGHRVLLMEIQPDENKAYIIQEQAARTGVLLGSSFETSEPTAMTPVALAASRWSRVVLNSTAPASYTANEGEHGLKAGGDWFQSRSIHGHLLETVRPTRGRIELASRAGAPMLTSTFDFDLGTVYYQAGDGSWWQTGSLPKGSTATLTPSTGADFKNWLNTQARLFSSGNARKIKTLTRLPGRYYTLTENAPATETYRSIKWLSTTTLITGKTDR